MPPSRLQGAQELDGLLGSESPSKDVDSSCWGRKRKKKKGSQEEQVSSRTTTWVASQMAPLFPM
jgi:hypothetical protein